MKVPDFLKETVIQSFIICGCLLVILWLATDWEQWQKIAVPAVLFAFLAWKDITGGQKDLRENPLEIINQIATTELGNKMGMPQRPINFLSDNIEFRFNKPFEFFFTYKPDGTAKTFTIGCDGKVSCPHKSRVTSFSNGALLSSSSLKSLSIAATGRTKLEEALKIVKDEGYIARPKDEQEEKEEGDENGERQV